MTKEHTPKFAAENLSLADVEDLAKKALMLACNVLATAGTPGHMYFVARHEKCLKTRSR
jgi:hypothetical protein